MTPRSNYATSYLNPTIFLGQYEDYDLYYCPNNFYFPVLVYQAGSRNMWQDRHPAVQEARRRARYLLSQRYSLFLEN